MKRIIERNGEFYLVKGILFKRWWDDHWKGGYWWPDDFKGHATGFDSEESLRKAYQDSRPKFKGFL